MTKKGRPYLRTGITVQEPPRHKIRAWREWFGWSQEVLAEKADLSVSAISAYERGIDDPSLDAIDKIAKAFDIPRGMLLDVDPNDDPPLWISVLRVSGQRAASAAKERATASPPGKRSR